jgi:hypothetical protein
MRSPASIAINDNANAATDFNSCEEVAGAVLWRRYLPGELRHRSKLSTSELAFEPKQNSFF